MGQDNSTPYEILDVPQDIDYPKLRQIYRTKIHEHLQKKISPSNFRRICRAYETLSDFDKRGCYNESKQWISELPIDKYTSQQLAAEPDLIRRLKQRLSNANLTTINAQDLVTGHTTLYCAARAGNIEAVKFLTEHGAEPDLSQRTKSTALHAASFFGHADVVRHLLESGADYRIVNSGNNTAESEAYNDDVKQVFAEMKQNAYVRVAANELDWFRENSLTQHQDTEYFSQRQTLLHCASKKGYSDMVCWLVEQQSANIDLVDYNRNSALHLASYGGHREIVEYLLNKGCDPTLRNRWGTIAEEEGSKHRTKITDLFKSMRERDMYEMAREGVDWWFYYYFDVNLKDSSDPSGISLLYYACRYGHYSVAKWLLEHGANVNIQMAAKPRSTALHVAKYRGHLSIIELLLKRGADVNIKNDFGYTVFEETLSAEVDNNLSNKINDLLSRYEHDLKNHKLIDVEIYSDEDTVNKPILTLQIDHKTRYIEIMSMLPKELSNANYYLSIAGRPLNPREPNKPVISAVCCARYTTSKLLDTPLRLTLHKKLLDSTRHHFDREDALVEPRKINQIFSEKTESRSFSLIFPFKKEQIFNFDDLSFTFSSTSITGNVTFKVTRLHASSVSNDSLPNALCFFETNVCSAAKQNTLVLLPRVFLARHPKARLYTKATSSTYWFSSDTRPNQLPMVGGIHAFIHHIDIIPNQLALPADVFFANTLNQPLKTRNNPVPCQYVVLRKHDINIYPHIAYHGTNIKAIQSILLDGLVLPGTVASSGKRINPPPNHISRGTVFFDILDFTAAIFLSPSVHYSSDGVYAIPFTCADQQMIPVLECSLKRNSFTAYKCTTKGYETRAHSSDNLNNIEWRVTDPLNIEINTILFITQIKSLVTATEERKKSMK